jgi:hypothetical protein
MRAILDFFGNDTHRKEAAGDGETNLVTKAGKPELKLKPKSRLRESLLKTEN